MKFRALQRSGFPTWIQALKKRSGVYVIREPAGAVLYVGESHSDRLYDTIRRHFATWTGPTAGPTYARSKIELAVIPTTAGAAVSAQNRLIRKLRPRDNIAEKPGLLSWLADKLTEDEPF